MNNTKKEKKKREQLTLGHCLRNVIRLIGHLEAHLGMLLRVPLHQRVQAVLLDEAPRAQQIHVNLQPDQPSGAAAGRRIRRLVLSHRRRGRGRCRSPSRRGQRLARGLGRCEAVVVVVEVVVWLVLLRRDADDW